MSPDGKASGDERENHEWFVPGSRFPDSRLGLVAIDMLQTIGEVKKDRDAEDPDDASQAYVATEIEGDGEDKKGSEKNHGAEGNKDSGGGGDPLASPPAQEDRVVVAHDGGQRGDHLDGVGEELLVGGEFPCQSPEKRERYERGLPRNSKEVGGKDYREESLEEIEQQARNSEALADDPEDVGGPGVARAMPGNVNSLGIRDENAKGNRSDQVCDNGKEPGHD